MSAAASLPFLIVIPGMSFTDAYFETMSGLTTTGSTVMVGLDQLAPAINLWRHALQWYGGMGIIVLAIAILPLLGVGGMQLYRAEVPGAYKDKLTPRIADTAKALWAVYAGITALCIVALRLAGMTWFDAVCHAFTAMSLGGYSTHDASVGHFDSPVIAARFEGRDVSALARQLRAERVLVSARHGNLRVSTHFYNNERDLEDFDRALGRIL